MLSVLDDQSRFPQANDGSLMNKWKDGFQRNPYFKALPGDHLNFIIKHYAGEVQIHQSQMAKHILHLEFG